jgi:acyl-CoA synthetase (AMP-forming)/AMP-acid ligase II
LFNGYGCTESTALAVCLTSEQHRQAVATGDDELLETVGQPVPGIELKIFDTHNREVPFGEAGQVALRGAKVSPGYLDNPNETRAKFLPDGWLLTGDQGRLTTGDNLVILGRLDEMMITGGLNVQPAEIENEVVTFKGVAECAAFSVKSERWGQEVRLALVQTPGADLNVEDLKQYLRARLDPYKLPKRIHMLDRLPRTDVGKVQRFRLEEFCDANARSSTGMART